MHPRTPSTGATAHRALLAGAAFAAIAALAPSTSASAQIGKPGVERSAPEVYAITNARIVPVSGPVIARGTIVVRNGLIQAVGANTAVPADARVVDGSGLSVYPGLIDAYSNLGIPNTRSQRGGGGAFVAAQQGGASTTAPNSLHPAGLQPELTALDLMDPAETTGSSFESARSAGITAALSVPRTGIFMGRSALISVSPASNPQDNVVRAPVALHVGFTAVRGGGYPGSLLGVFASLRQMLLDAQHYGLEQAAYAKNPRGMERPQHDASMEALQPVLTGQMPVVMLASSEREIRRALNLADEFKLRVIIAGGEEAYKVSDRLSEMKVPVIATLDFPRRRQAPSANADPEPLRVLKERVEAPKNAGRLADAGINIAFTSGSMSSMNDFLPNMRKAVDGGLSRDRALRALTLGAAEMLGVADRMGSIEPGKIANLALVRGDIFEPGARVTQVFVDGQAYAVHAPANSNSRASASGTWTITVNMGSGDKQVTLNLQQSGERLTGGIQGPFGTSQISNGSIGADGRVHFTASLTLDNTTEEATFEGTVTGSTTRGTVTIIGEAQGTFAGSRPDQQRQRRTP